METKADAKAMIDRMALAVLDNQADEGDYERARERAPARWDLLRIHQIRRALLPDVDRGQPSFEQLKLTLATYRYDYRARTKRRRAEAKLKR